MTTQHPDLIIRDGAVRTIDPGNPRAEAVAVTGDRITAVGTNADVASLAGPRTEIVSAAGNTVMPGVVDAHNHIRLGANTRAVQLAGANDLGEIRARIAAHIAAHPDADWIEGEGWNYTAVPGGTPTAAMIDEVCQGRPAWLFSYDVHTVWLNSEGLRRWGIREKGDGVPFGHPEYDADGHPTGFVRDFAVLGIHPIGQRALEAVLPGYGKDAQYERVVENLRAAARFGITTIVEPQNGLGDIALFQRARDEGELRSRLVAALMFSPESDPDDLDRFTEAKRAFDDDRLRVGPVKLYIDDVVEPHTAAMLAPYHNHAGHGETFWAPADFAELLVRLENRGLQAFTHATGDRGIRTVLDAVAHARSVNGPRDARHQIVHVECLHPDDLPRFAELGVVACMQPRHAGPDLVGEWRENVGPERERLAWAMRSLADAGATLAFSSDWNVGEMDPMVGIYSALTRADLTGRNAWNVAETLDLDRTLRAYTAGSAYSVFAEHDRGMLTPGRYADIIVLSKDLDACEPLDVLQTGVEVTVTGGEIVHRTR